MSNGKMTDYQSKTVKDWVEMIHHRELAVPGFQRSYVWKEKQVKDLLIALLMDRPIGAFLTIRFAKDHPSGKFRPRPFYKVGNQEQTSEDCRELVLDGQQRLTSLWWAFEGKQLRHKYFVRVENWNADQLEIAKDNPVCSRKANEAVVKDEASAKKENLIPVSVLGINGATQEKDALFKWCKSAYGDHKMGQEKARKGIM